MINGVLNVYKEKGYTSHDVVAKLRGILKQKKIGHTGTLDPEAEGVLPVCLGRGTKLCGMLTDKRKTYQAVLRLGDRYRYPGYDRRGYQPLPCRSNNRRSGKLYQKLCGKSDADPAYVFRFESRREKAL